MNPLRKYLFASLATNAYRLTEVIACNEDHARSMLKTNVGVIYLTVQPITRTAKQGVKSRLFRDVEKWCVFLDKFFLMKRDIDIAIAKSLKESLKERNYS